MATDLIIQPAVASAFAWAGSQYILQNSGQVSVAGYSLDKNIAFAGLVGAGSMIANATKDYVIPKIPIQDPQYKMWAQKAVGPAVKNLLFFPDNFRSVVEQLSDLRLLLVQPMFLCRISLEVFRIKVIAWQILLSQPEVTLLQTMLLAWSKKHSVKYVKKVCLINSNATKTKTNF
jgi:hypothetical protein